MKKKFYYGFYQMENKYFSMILKKNVHCIIESLNCQIAFKNIYYYENHKYFDFIYF